MRINNIISILLIFQTEAAEKEGPSHEPFPEKQQSDPQIQG